LNNSCRTYLTLHENSDPELLDAKLRKYDLEGFNGNTWSFHLQPLFDIHFNRDTWGKGNKGTLFLFLTAGVFIFFIVCFNYLNLYIAHYRTRIRDVSIRKVTGASGAALLNFLLRDSVRIILVSTVFGGVFGWYLAMEWLENFAFRCRFGFGAIALSALLAFLIYFFMISFRLIGAISNNPGDSLRLD